jgi:catechol 2,3-dioxygenase
MTDVPVHPAVRVGHVHLRVADLDRSLTFYRDTLGLSVTGDGRTQGVPAVFLAAGDYHHHIALNTFNGARAAPADRTRAGLYHVAFVYPDRRELIRALERVVGHGHPIDHASDHGATVSAYLSDPDGNGIELYYDRPRQSWHDADGQPVLRNDPFDYRALLTHTTDQGE